MVRVCLVRPPSIVNPIAYIASLTPPIGLAYIAASLRAAGHHVDLIDGVGEDPLRSTSIGKDLVLRGLPFDEIVARIPEDADIIGVSCMFSSEWVQIRDLVNRIGARFPSKLIVGGGEHFTAAAEVSMKHCPHLAACVLGEGEETAVALANAVAAGSDLASVPGLAIRGAEGIRRTPPRARIRAIDEIAAPAWDLVPMQSYFDNNLSYGVYRGRSMPMLASRGCPYQCTFCSNPLMWTTRWLARTPARVVDEIAGYVQRFGVENVDFYDLTAIVKRDWIIEFCQELLRRDVKITWQLPSGTRSEAIDAEVAKWLYDSGCRNLNYAPESGSEETLKNIKKKVKLGNLLRSLRASVKTGMNVKVNIIIGLPDETARDIRKTLRFLVKLSWFGAHDVSIGVFAPYPGSALYERLVAEGRITHSDEYFSTLAYVDISETVSYTKHISSRRLRFYNWLGFALFYGSNYLFRPQRFFRTLYNLATHRHESRGEMALSALFNRLRTAKRAQSLAAITPDA